jgi:hypothetical protein
MPRKSADALAGAWFRARQQHGTSGRPKPPSWLSADAQKTFKAIVASRAPDLFGPGSIELLAHFCFAHHQAIKLWSLAAEYKPESAEARCFEKRALAFVALAASLGGKCALLPRHLHGNRSGVLSERVVGTVAEDGSVLPWPANETPF